MTETSKQARVWIGVFPVFLATLWMVLAVYTALVIRSHGLGLLPLFFGAVGRVDWTGQFNLDFLMMLCLSALWVAWRHHGSAAGIALALLALTGGSAFICPYLLVQSWRCNGNLPAVLVGPQRLVN